MSSRRLEILDIAVPLGALALGLTIYLLFRDGMMLHVWLDPARRTHAAAHALHVPAWFRYSVPDGLWQLAFSFVLARIWCDHPSVWVRAAWATAAVFIGLGTELGQALGLVEGVYDVGDLGALLAGAAVGAYLGRAQVAQAMQAACNPRMRCARGV